MRALLLLLPLLSACSGTSEAQNPTSMSNPASVYCLNQGGSLEMRGETGMCHLKDGRVIEEWAYLRSAEQI